MKNEVSREEYNVAIEIRSKGYNCTGIRCTFCAGQKEKLCRENHDSEKIFHDWVDSIISVYEADHPEEFGKSPRVYDYRDAELEEVHALIGKRVYASDWLKKINELSKVTTVILARIESGSGIPFVSELGVHWQFISPVDTIELTQSELIEFYAKERSLRADQIRVRV